MANKEAFKLLELLGCGTFARTHKAQVLPPRLIEQYGTDIVALKIPLDEEKAEALKREVKMYEWLKDHLDRLQPPNVIRYLDFRPYENQIVMAMEYVEHGSLRDLIARSGRQRQLPVNEAVRITKGVLRGLAVIHGERVFHRDIKPENILMDGRTPKLTDLGVSKMLESNELASTTCGTICYMSPEILSTEGAAFPSDIWSTGVTLYEMLTGQLPFGGIGRPLKEMVDLICYADPAPVQELRPEVPVALGDIVSRSMHKDSRQRYGSAREMYEALEHFERGCNENLDKELASIQAAMSALDQSGAIETRLLGLLREYPHNTQVHRHLGAFYNRCSRHEEAIKAFRQGLECDPDDALLHWDLAVTYHSVNRLTDAIDSAKRALALGLNTRLHRHAINFLRKLGDKDYGAV